MVNKRIKEIVLATQNPSKLYEINDILNKHSLQIDFTLINSYTKIEAIEDGNSFEENALIKAEFAYLHSGKPSLSEDSGLCISALSNAPGIYSKRWNENGDNTYNVAFNKIKKLMKFSEDKSAHFVSVFCLYEGLGKYKFFKAQLDGKITFSPIGDNGFAYDRIFIPNGFSKTMAQIETEEKNQISHRKKSLDMLIKYLNTQKV